MIIIIQVDTSKLNIYIDSVDKPTETFFRFWYNMKAGFKPFPNFVHSLTVTKVMAIWSWLIAMIFRNGILRQTGLKWDWFNFTGLTRAVCKERYTASLYKQTNVTLKSFPLFIMGIVSELLITPCLFRWHESCTTEKRVQRNCSCTCAYNWLLSDSSLVNLSSNPLSLDVK